MPVIVLGVLSVSLFFTVGVYFLQDDNPAPFLRKAISKFHRENAEFFAPEYPVNSKVHDELAQLRSNGRLNPEKEKLINYWILEASQSLDIPEALLWCLLFQESRFDNLIGINGENPALGIGQFSHYSFYELNHNLTKYTDNNLRLLKSAAGRDPRPINSLNKDASDPSSYYYIPTGVTASATYLNNRYFELAGVLEAKNIHYHPELLWLFAAMAYNKGSRSVLTLWNELQKDNSPISVEEALSDGKALFKTMKEAKLIQRSLARIWPDDFAQLHAKELFIHMQQIEQCSMRPKYTASLKVEQTND